MAENNQIEPAAEDVGGTLIPRTFWQYVCGIGPGLMIALTWLGAGDLVDSALAGGNYGYSLMWALALALFVRFVFVSIIAKYQLCNQHGESVMAGLYRLHRSVPVLIGIIALFFGHFYGSFLVTGVGEASHRLFGVGPDWAWSCFWVAAAAFFVFRGVFNRIEKVFYVFLGLLSVSLIGVALKSGPDPVGIIKGIFLFDLPEQRGSFSVSLIVISLIGAVGGSIANLLYPYFIQQKGWKGPRFRRLQLYDLAFGTLVLVVLDLAVWTVGAEVLHPQNLTIESFPDLANLLTIVMGDLGGAIFYLGVFAALYSSVIGNAAGYGLLCTDIARILRTGEGTSAGRQDVSRSGVYRGVAMWCLFSPLIWTLPGMPDFITLTVIANAAGVVVLPLLSGGLWLITARSIYIGEVYRNRWWENLVMALLFVLAVIGSYQFIIAFADYF